MGQLNLDIEQIEDPVGRQNFQKIERKINRDFFLGTNWTYFEFELEASVIGKQIQHALKFKPEHIFILWEENVTLDYDQITDEHFTVTASSSGVIKFLAGTIGRK